MHRNFKCDDKNMTNQCFFSIITVSYNAQDTIEDTIKSILRQKCHDYEYLVVDGFSRDDTLKIVGQYEGKFNGKMRWISEPDKGIYDAMNKGLQMANGKYVIFVNADDSLCKNILGVIKEIILCEDTPPAIVYGDCINIYEDNDRTLERIRKSFSRIDNKTLIKGMGVVHQSMFTSNALFEKIGAFDLQFPIGADWDFLIRAVKSNAQLQYVPLAVCRFRTVGISASIHNWQRHRIRKKNRLYKWVDAGLFMDVLNMKTMIQLLIGDKLYRKIRYKYNAGRKIN